MPGTKIEIYIYIFFKNILLKVTLKISATPIKRTSVEKMVNIQIIFLFCILLTMSLACSIGFFIRAVSICNIYLFLRILK